MMNILYNIPLAQEDLEDLINRDAFSLPLLALKILAVAFLLFAMFKAVTALASTKYGQVFGWIVAGAAGVFIGFNPTIIATIIEGIGSVFSALVDLLFGGGNS